MSITTTFVPALIAAGDSLRIENGAGTVIRSAKGDIWITQEGDVRDVVLSRGQSFTLDRNGLALLVALDRAAVAQIECHKTQAAAALVPALRPGRGALCPSLGERRALNAHAA